MAEMFTEAYRFELGQFRQEFASPFDQYAELCSDLGVAPKSRPDLVRNRRPHHRPFVSVTLGSKGTIGLGDDLTAVKQRFGSGESRPIVRGTSLVAVHYREHGLRLLASGQVLAISLTQENSPALPLQASGLTAGKAALRVGMTKAEIDKLLEGEDYDYRQITDPDVNYRFYRALGLAVRVVRGKVVELVVVQVPARSLIGGR